MTPPRMAVPLLAVILLAVIPLGGCGGDGGGTEPVPVSQEETVPPSAPADTPTAPPPPATAPDGKPPASAPPAAGAADAADAEERVRKAMRLIGEMALAYRAAPTLTDRIEVETIWGGQRLPSESVTMRMGQGKDIFIETKSDRITVLGDKLYFELLETPDRFLEFPLEVDVLQTLQKNFNSYGGIMLQPALRYGRPLPEVIYNLEFGLPDRARISGYRTITDNEGRPFEQISLVSPAGSALVNVDPETKLIQGAYVEYEEPGAPIPNFQVARLLKFHPEVHDELPEPITFDAAGRMAADSPRSLRGRVDDSTLERMTVAVGDEAPDFRLFSLRGEGWKLNDHRGSVVVLVFWAGWNVESLNGIKMLKEVAAWIEAGGHPVEMVAINTLRKEADPAESWEKALDYWEREDMNFPSLEDPQGEVAGLFGVVGVPVTVVLDRQGRAVAIEAGLSEDTPARLTESVLAALDAR